MESGETAHFPHAWCSGQGSIGKGGIGDGAVALIDQDARCDGSCRGSGQITSASSSKAVATRRHSLPVSTPSS
jgi:hypothetical protein